MATPFTVSPWEERRFWKYVEKLEPTDCWEWRGTKDGSGYGRIGISGKPRGAHRVSFVINGGELVKELEICHTCDNPPCVNPNHLFQATRSENIKDSYVKGRHKITRQWLAERNTGLHPRAKITEEEAIYIYRSERLPRGLAAQFGISLSTVFAIKRGIRWSNTTIPQNV